GAQRLPNGNTLIATGFTGSIFEVTPKKEVVWKYVAPLDAGGRGNFFMLGGWGGGGPPVRALRLRPQDQGPAGPGPQTGPDHRRDGRGGQNQEEVTDATHPLAAAGRPPGRGGDARQGRRLRRARRGLRPGRVLPGGVRRLPLRPDDADHLAGAPRLE